MKDASVKAAEQLNTGCPAYQTLTGRIEAMEKRLDAAFGAVKTMRPALTKFYDSLSDEQKARFNSLRSASQQTGYRQKDSRRHITPGVAAVGDEIDATPFTFTVTIVGGGGHWCQ
jgi:hypothetical protein